MVINCTNLFSLTKNFIVSSDGYQLNNFTNILNPLIFVLGGFRLWGTRWRYYFLAKIFVKIKKLGGYPLKNQIFFQKFSLF
jgi:hypothetical protein